MNRIKRELTHIFLMVLCLAFLCSCTFFDQQTKKETKEAPPKATPAVASDVKTSPKAATPQDVKEHPHPQPKKVPAATVEKPHEHKPAAKEPESKATQASKIQAEQQKYYNTGMRYYSQEKYVEAKKAWQTVIKLGRKTDLAEKARENIKKVDQILKTLKEMSGK